MNIEKLPKTDSSPKYKIGDEIWFMKDDKPVCYFVDMIKKIEFLSIKSEYGFGYGHEILIYYEYRIVDDINNTYKRIFIDNFTTVMKKYFRTKQELIDSL